MAAASVAGLKSHDYKGSIGASDRQNLSFINRVVCCISLNLIFTAGNLSTRV